MSITYSLFALTCPTVFLKVTCSFFNRFPSYKYQQISDPVFINTVAFKMSQSKVSCMSHKRSIQVQCPQEFEYIVLVQL